MVPHSDTQRRVLEMERQRLLERARREHLADLAGIGHPAPIAARPALRSAVTATARRMADDLGRFLGPLVWPRPIGAAETPHRRDGDAAHPLADEAAVAVAAAS